MLTKNELMKRNGFEEFLWLIYIYPTCSVVDEWHSNETSQCPMHITEMHVTWKQILNIFSNALFWVIPSWINLANKSEYNLFVIKVFCYCLFLLVWKIAVNLPNEISEFFKQFKCIFKIFFRIIRIEKTRLNSIIIEMQFESSLMHIHMKV